MGKKLTTEEFIKKAKKAHNERYDYSKVKYKYWKKEVVIICKIHGEFKQKAANHLTGKGCRKCGVEKRAKNRSLTKENFIEKAKQIHKNKYNYSRVNYYKNNTSKVEIICNKHGSFMQAPGSHLNGNGCSDCAAEKALKTTKSFIDESKKIHKNRYDYSKTNYKKHDEKIIIVCGIHGEFKQSPSCHLSGCGCPHCKFKNEGKVKNLLLKYFKEWKIIPNKKIWDRYKNYNHKRYCDFWLEKNDIRIIVEYDGELHFKPVCFNGMSLKFAKKNLKHYQLKDRLDAEFCKENNIILHRIKYDEDKEQLIKNLLKKVS